YWSKISILKKMVGIFTQTLKQMTLLSKNDLNNYSDETL
ncbi:unnamed protein product, partial [marine sediment metagenome]